MASSGMPLEGYIFMAALSLQFGLQPVFTKEFVAPDVIKTTSVLVCEMCKCLLAASSLVASGQLKQALANWTLRGSLLVAGVPSIIYAVQNVMIQTAYQHLDPLTFNLINQTKMLFTAVFVWVFVGRTQSPLQCAALGLVMLSAVVLVSGGRPEGADDSKAASDAYSLGIACVLGASLSSGLATAYCQKVLTGSGARNSLLFSLELSAMTSTTLLLKIASDHMLGSAPGAAAGASFDVVALFVGWTPLTMIPILTNASGGLFVGLVTKYAGGVRKGFTVIIGICITAFAKLAVYGEALSPQTLVALPLVTVACWLHISFPTKPKEKKQ
eukprot:g6322.t1